MTWTTIPPWLYQNELPDEELQEVYVREAERKWRALRDGRAAIEADLADAVAAEARAYAFLQEAKAALARYRPARAQVTERKRLPKR